MGAETGDDMTDVQEKSSQKKWHQSCILGNGLEFSDAKVPQPLVIFFSPMYPNSWSLCQGSPNLAPQQIHQELSKMVHPGPTPKENLCSLRSEGESCGLARFGNHYSHSIPFILFTEDLH